MKLLDVRISVLLVVLLSFVFSLSASEPSPGYLDLNGKDRYVKIPQSDDFAIPAGGTMTITFKVTLNASDVLPRDQVYISSLVRNDLNISSKNDDFVGFEVSQTLYSDVYRPIINVRYKNSGSQIGLNTADNIEVIPANTIHMSLIYDGFAKKFYGYFDGEEMFPGNFKEVLNYDVPNYEGVLFGARYTCSSGDAFSPDKIERFLNGQIDDVRFYRDALTEDEIKADMASSLPLSGKSVIAAYDFTDLSEGKVRDISGNGHDGVLMGGSWPEYEAGSGEIVDERPIVTIEQSEGGKIFVYMGENAEVTSGSRVDSGSELTIVAVPNSEYELKSITVNRESMDFDDENSTSFTISENSTVSAQFQKKSQPQQPVDPPGDDTGIWPGMLVLNGSDRYLRIPHDDRFTIQPNGSQTICFNVVLREDASNRQTLIGSRSHQINKSGKEEKGGIEIYLDSKGLHGLYVYNKENKGSANFNAEAKSEISLPLNVNKHIALVYDGNIKSVSLYSDGTLIGNGVTMDYIVPIFGDILVGCRYVNGHESEDGLEYFANGIFDDIHIYTSALTPEQVNMDKEGKELPQSAGLIAAYDFTDFNGREIRDVSGNGHTAYMMGDSWPEYTVANTFAINFSSEGDGILTVSHGGSELRSGDKIDQSETITIKAIADEGNRLKSLTINDEERIPDTDGLLTVEVTKELTVLAVFEPIPADIKKYIVNVTPV